MAAANDDTKNEASMKLMGRLLRAAACLGVSQENRVLKDVVVDQSRYSSTVMLSNAAFGQNTFHFMKYFLRHSNSEVI